MLIWRRIASAAVVWAALAGLGGIAQAHPGHDHARPASADQYRAASAVELDFSEISLGRASLAEGREIRAPHPEWTATAPIRPVDAEMNACSDRGCCAPGSCYVGIGLVAPDLPATVPPSLSGAVFARDGPPRAGVSAPSLRRPPKTFA